MNADMDDEITGLRNHVRQLRNVAQEIHSEATFQKDFLDQLQMTLIKAQAGVKNNMRRLNKNIVKHEDEVFIYHRRYVSSCGWCSNHPLRKNSMTLLFDP
ncbi:hypothetical protein Q3G72_019307 [Acer saccharum]|nr:hypothetical protein Q3G72_019307 [Acer saccharum]